MARSLRSDIVNRIESEMEGAGEKEVAVEDATNHRTEEVTTDNTTGETGTAQRRRFSTRSQCENILMPRKLNLQPLSFKLEISNFATVPSTLMLNLKTK